VVSFETDPFNMDVRIMPVKRRPRPGKADLIQAADQSSKCGLLTISQAHLLRETRKVLMVQY
jgi:hypothetical protein